MKSHTRDLPVQETGNGHPTGREGGCESLNFSPVPLTPITLARASRCAAGVSCPVRQHVDVPALFCPRAGICLTCRRKQTTVQSGRRTPAAQAFRPNGPLREPEWSPTTRSQLFHRPYGLAGESSHGRDGGKLMRDAIAACGVVLIGKAGR